MKTLLLVPLAIIITALVVWNLPRLRAQAAAPRLRPRIGPDVGQAPMSPPPERY